MKVRIVGVGVLLPTSTHPCTLLKFTFLESWVGHHNFLPLFLSSLRLINRFVCLPNYMLLELTGMPWKMLQGYVEWKTLHILYSNTDLWTDQNWHNKLQCRKIHFPVTRKIECHLVNVLRISEPKQRCQAWLQSNFTCVDCSYWVSFRYNIHCRWERERKIPSLWSLCLKLGLFLNSFTSFLPNLLGYMIM